LNIDYSDVAVNIQLKVVNSQLLGVSGITAWLTQASDGWFPFCGKMAKWGPVAKSGRAKTVSVTDVGLTIEY
jgi:hypothetical protein